jgi:hypothetical protein
LSGQRTPAQAGDPKSQSKDAPGKGRRAQEFIQAFNNGDVRTIAGFWTPTGDYVDQAGRRYQGRAELEKLYAKLFAGNKGATLALTVSSAHDGIEWGVGDWIGEAEKGELARASYAWAEDRNFIVSSFDATLNGIPVIGGTQWIGWDAIDKQVRSWTFYSGGGFGAAVWTRDGETWSLKTTAQTADGKKISATNVITWTDNDHLTWQVTRLVVDGQPVTDPAVVKMVRVKAEQK